MLLSREQPASQVLDGPPAVPAVLEVWAHVLVGVPQRAHRAPLQEVLPLLQGTGSHRGVEAGGPPARGAQDLELRGVQARSRWHASCRLRVLLQLVVFIVAFIAVFVVVFIVLQDGSVLSSQACCTDNGPRVAQRHAAQGLHADVAPQNRKQAPLPEGQCACSLPCKRQFPSPPIFNGGESLFIDGPACARVAARQPDRVDRVSGLVDADRKHLVVPLPQGDLPPLTFWRHALETLRVHATVRPNSIQMAVAHCQRPHPMLGDHGPLRGRCHLIQALEVHAVVQADGVDRAAGRDGEARHGRPRDPLPEGACLAVVARVDAVVLGCNSIDVAAVIRNVQQLFSPGGWR
mmetsp:Transcript_19213/g.54263  ORF Transcript_19213/g.54263 Transcript_19213/m.54263 type:complete len:348 (+) Transcript_19213:686-1729(+)